MAARSLRQLTAFIALILVVLLIVATLSMHSTTVDLTDLSPSKKLDSSWSNALSLSGKKPLHKPLEPIMGAMKNETIKAELGRSAWRLLHTMAGKFPHKPTQDQKTALNDFIYLFAQLYPCGDCARHFKLILEANPPDVSGKAAAADWACRVHNLVNKRKGKPQFDCSKILEFYDCGCGPEEEEEGA